MSIDPKKVTDLGGSPEAFQTAMGNVSERFLGHRLVGFRIDADRDPTILYLTFDNQRDANALAVAVGSDGRLMVGLGRTVDG